MEKERYKDIELRSEEVQEVMNKVPPAILRYGIGVLTAIVGVLLVGSALFRYPESVQVAVTVSTRTPPAYIKCVNGGRLERLYAANGQVMKRGEALAVMENTADTGELLRLRERLGHWQADGARPERLDRVFFHRPPKLGSVQGAYAACQLAWNNYLQHAGENRIHETELYNALAQLAVALDEWERSYLPTAPTDGQVAFMQLWKEGNYVVEISITRMPDKQPPVLKVMDGTAEIIVREESLLERLLLF